MDDRRPVFHIPISDETEEQAIKKILASFVPCSACKTLGWDCDCEDKNKCAEHLYIKMKLHFIEGSKK